MDGPAADPGTLAGSGSDAALVLAAVDRMQRAELRARLSLIRLRSGLGEMALTVGRAKAANPDEPDREIDTAALLDEFEHRIDAMLEIAGGRIAAKPAAPEPAAPEPAALPAEPVQSASEMPAKPDPAAEASAAEAEQVPTISCVVSGCDAEAAAEPAVGPHDAALAATGPTVEMLRSLVAALNASIPAEPAAAGPSPAVTEQPVPEGAAAEPAAGPHDTALAAAGPTVEMLRSLVAALNVSIPAEPAAAGPPPAVAERPVPENAAEVARLAPSESIAEGGREFAPEIAAPDLVAAVAEAAAAERPLEAPQETGEDTEPLVFDVIVEFDKAERAAPTAPPQEHDAAPEAAAIAEAVAAPEPEAAVHEADAAPPPDQPAATIEPVAEAPVPETLPLPDAAVEPADQSPQQPAAGQVTAEDILADLPAIAYEASSPVWVQAALRQDAVYIHEIELLARFEQMEALPLLPPEIGTAVIFNPRSAPPPEIAEAPQPPAAETETFSAEATPEAAAADTVVTESLAPKALLPKTAAVGPATKIPAVVSSAVKEAQAAVAPATQAGPSVQPEPEAAAGEDWTVEFGLTAALLPPVDSDSAPSGEALAAGPPEQEAAPATAGAAPAAEAPTPETDAVPQAAAELPPVDVEFDTDKFLFGEGAAETAERAANGAENPPAAAAPAPEAETAGTTASQAETQPDPLIPIKAMSPEERIALFS